MCGHVFYVILFNIVNVALTDCKQTGGSIKDTACMMYQLSLTISLHCCSYLVLPYFRFVLRFVLGDV